MQIGDIVICDFFHKDVNGKLGTIIKINGTVFTVKFFVPFKTPEWYDQDSAMENILEVSEIHLKTITSLTIEETIQKLTLS